MKPTDPISCDVIVIGAGAAGLMCAAQAGYRGRSVRVLDHANKPGKKILMSGGGRCNFTNLVVEPRHFLSANPHFCKSALARYKPQDFIELVERHGVAYHEKNQGQLFCDNKSSDILNLLLTECDWAGVQLQLHCDIGRIEKMAEGFRLNTSQGDYVCQSLVIATGGLSIPTLGASGFGYKLAEQFGLSVTARRASLVPFTLTDKWHAVVSDLSGLSLPVRVRAQCGQQFSEPLLFTHRGLSGPAMLQISNYWQPGESLWVNFCPTLDLLQQMQTWQQAGEKAELKTLLSNLMPKRFVQAWLEQSVGNKPMAHYSGAELAVLAEAFGNWQVTPSGTEGYRTAEVTLGGVDTDAVSSKTFEVKTVPGLYLVGEVLDVTGWLGGYNFQWAWASGYCAGQYV